MHPPLILTNPELGRLHCKPDQVKQCVHYSKSAHLAQAISFRSLDLQEDLPQIHEWVNMDYTSRYWQMDGPFEWLREIYEQILSHPNAHSFVGYYGDQLICQLDVYQIGVDELSYLIPEASHQCGFHLLMAPNKLPIKGLTSAIIKSFLEFYFSFETSEKMYAEPDASNQKSIDLLQEAGFCFLKTIELSYKTAHLFYLDKKSFLNHISPCISTMAL